MRNLRFNVALVSVLSAACLSACASTPTSGALFAGIDSAALEKTAVPASGRLATDPVCTRFYQNTRDYLVKASKPNGMTQFFTQVGVSVLAGVATQGLASGVGSGVGRVAIQSAAGSAIQSGSGIALRELSKNDSGDAKVIALAEQIGCPVSVI